MNDRTERRILRIRGRCPMCGTTMVLRVTEEALTLHKCVGCIYTLAITPDNVMVLPTAFAESLMAQAEAEVCGEIVENDLSTRYQYTGKIDDDYMEILTQFLRTSGDLDPNEVVDFLNLVDDSHRDQKTDQ